MGCGSASQCSPEGRCLYQVVSTPLGFGDLRSFRIISEGFKSNFIPFCASERRAHEPDAEYWRDLGQSSAFDGEILINCIHRLHEDVLKVWNFNDPTGVSYIFLSISSIVIDVHCRSCQGSNFLLKLLALSSLLLRIGMVRHRALLLGCIGSMMEAV